MSVHVTGGQKSGTREGNEDEVKKEKKRKV